MMPLNLPEYPKQFIEAYVRHMTTIYLERLVMETLVTKISNKYSSDLRRIFGSKSAALIKRLILENVLEKDYYSDIQNYTGQSLAFFLKELLGTDNAILVNKVHQKSFLEYRRETWYDHFEQDLQSEIGDLHVTIANLKELVKEVSTKEYKDFETCFKALLLLTPEEMEKYRQQHPGGMSGSFQDIKSLYDLSQKIVIDGKVEKINTYMVKHFMVSDNRGLLVCPYCNRNYINSRDRKLGAEMDHFYSKDQFPMFAVSLYNFIPSCGTCNRIKSNKDLSINPYIVKTSGSPQVRFDIEPTALNRYKISLKEEQDGQLCELQDKLKHDIQEVLKLHDAYQVHEWDICDMVQREQEYGKEHRDFLVNLLSKQYSKEEVNTRIDDLIYGSVISMSEDKLVNVSLGKFKKDAYKKIKEWTTNELI